MAKKIAALIVIYVGCTLAWVILGSSIFFRTQSFSPRLEDQVRLLWGGEHCQTPPQAYYVEDRVRETEEMADDGSTKRIKTVEQVNVDLPLAASDIGVRLSYEPRKKGLLWYSTYRVRFRGTYTVENTSGQARSVHVDFRFPSADAQYDDFQLQGPQGDLAYMNAQGKIMFYRDLEPGEKLVFTVGYRSRGLSKWTYAFTPASEYGAYGAVAQVRNFRLQMDTDFDRIDFPEGSMSPHEKHEQDGGWRLQWKTRNLITGLNVGMLMPEELNPGPLAARITFFAPVSLLFFLFILFVVVVLKKIELHPMHYFFLSLSFFAFHLLFAYLVDHLDVHLAFALSAALSIGLVVSYIRLVVGPRFAFVETGLLQLLYLVVFSYTHFFKGYTGLMVTVFAVVTLFFVMQLTARVKWGQAFRSPRRPAEASEAG
jgi:hypothetical protein